MGKPLVVIAIRSNVDWLEMSKEKFFAQGKGPINEDIFKKKDYWLSKHWDYIQIWNSYLKRDYFRTRHKMQKFAERTHNQIKGIDLIVKGKEAIFQFVKRYKSDNWIMLPTDDDDCFNPTVVDKVLENDKAEVVKWNTVCFDTTHPAYGMRLMLMGNAIFPSNSYALTSKAAVKLPKLALEEMICRHCLVRHYSQAFLLKCKRIQDTLSLYNKNPLSFSATREKAMVPAKIHKYLDTVGKALAGPINYEYPWTAPYITGFRRILQDCY